MAVVDISGDIKTALDNIAKALSDLATAIDTHQHSALNAAPNTGKVNNTYTHVGRNK